MWRALGPEMRGGLFLLCLGFSSLICLGHLDWHDPIIIILDNLRFHLAVLLAFLALALALAGARLRGLVLFGFSILVVVLVHRDIGSSSRLLEKSEPDLTVIAFNVLGTNVENGKAIAAFLAGSGADLVLLNEAYPIMPFLEDLKSEYPFQVGCGDPAVGAGSCGDVLVLSRLELHEPSISRLTDASDHQTITARIEVDGNQVNVVATHLLRPYLGEQHTREFSALTRLIAGLEGTTVVAGDFNAAAWFRPFKEMLDATGLVRVFFEPGTWPVGLRDFGVPIDHVLVSGAAAMVSLSALPDHFGSNHRGLIAEIALAADPKELT